MGRVPDSLGTGGIGWTRGASRRRVLVGLAAGAGGALVACQTGGGESAGGAQRRVKGGSAVFMAWGDPERTRIRDGLVARIRDTSRAATGGASTVSPRAAARTASASCGSGVSVSR